MLDNNFQPDELLYRIINPKSSFWDEEKNRPSSGAFKEKEGLSVDRLGQRTEDEAISTLKKRDFNIRCLCAFSVDFCKRLPAIVLYKPEIDNEFHSEVHDSEEKIILSSSKAKKLAKNSRVINL